VVQAQPLELGAITGLSEQEAADRLRQDGPNELPSSKPRNVLAIAAEVVREPMFLLLVACGTLYLVLGDLEEAVLLLGFVFVVMGITLYQERKTERALEALRDLSSPRALVVRDGHQRRIAGREVVRGDILLLAEGDRVPADAVLLACVNLSADESLLTGESVPVRKVASAGDGPMGRPGGDDLPFVFSGTLVVQGQGAARVLATGLHTEMGKIGKALQAVEVEGTPLQTETRRVVRVMAAVGLSMCVLVAVVYGLTRGSWTGGVLAGITMAMAMLPEEFPVVLTVFLALGAWRLSRQRVLTRRVPAIETLGATTVLCVDKTGTLTLNRMSVARLAAAGSVYDVPDPGGPLPEAVHEVVEYAILASRPDPFDPMEKAFHDLGSRHLAGTEHVHRDWTLVREYPLSPGLLAMSQVWRSPGGESYVIAAKGAPEAVADLCHLDPAQAERLAAEVRRMAEDGLRVLAVARAAFRPADLPGGQHDFAFQLVGLVGLADPVRPTVPDAIRECYAAGIRVVMITGDYPATASSIARQIGLANPDETLTGPDIDRLDDAQLRERLRTVSVCARVVPEQKLRLVNALKANGEVVAMTGDGVNDAPALKAAHVGVAMGGRGTDVAREASDLVLLDDDFSSIVRAVRQGRRIFDNLRKAMAYVIAVHVPIAGLSLLPVLFGWPLILLPVHVVFLELIIDPACSVVFEMEAEEADVMRRPPRGPGEPLFSVPLLGLSVLQGLSVLVIVLAVFLLARSWGHDELDSRALAFTTLIVANLGLILANRSWTRTILATLRTPNPALWWVVGGAVAFLGLVLYVPFLTALFKFDRLHADDLLVCLASGVASVLWFEGLKLAGSAGRRAGRVGRPGEAG
jgi:Ca2+-transporting ATPase